MKFKEPKRIKKLLTDYNGTWMVAGGWSIDLYLNKETRIHSDIEIGIPRNEQFKIKSYLTNWNLEFIKSGKVNKWKNGEFLELPIHEIQGTKGGEKIEILLNELDDKKWKYRRNLQIEYPIEKTVINTNLEIPILCPEIVLLYKSKSIKKKDIKDLINTIEFIDRSKLIWLKNAIKETHGVTHEWLKIIEKKCQALKPVQNKKQI